jgi:hypothetical protein
VLEILNNGPETYFNTAGIERLLARQVEDCQACKTTHKSVQVSGGHWASDDDEEEDDKEDDKEEDLELEDSEDDE